MTTPDRREILERVARGELTPEEADDLLSGKHADAPAAGADAAEGSPVRRVRISAGFGAITVTADPDVAEAEIEGMHSATVEDDCLVIRGDAEPARPGAFAIKIGLGLQRSRGLRIGEHTASSLRVRVNPSFDVEAKIDAGPLSITGVQGHIRARSAAGPITIEDFGSTLDVSVNAGAVRAVGKITAGESRIRSDAGAVRVELDPSSSVRIVADAALGKVVLPGAEGPDRRRFGSRREAVLGDGEGELRVETAMGSIHVSTD